MSDSPVQAAERDRQAELRVRAASRLSGAAATKGATARAADALAVLHALASSPATASDALALLHELQVHQVEIDLQAQELRDSRAELETALRRQIERLDHQPVGCFTIDPRLTLHELNLSGAEMLEVARDEAYGLRLDACFCAESAGRFRAAVARVGAGEAHATCRVMLCARSGAQRPMLASLRADPTGPQTLVNLTPLPEGLAPAPD